MKAMACSAAEFAESGSRAGEASVARQRLGLHPRRVATQRGRSGCGIRQEQARARARRATGLAPSGRRRGSPSYPNSFTRTMRRCAFGGCPLRSAIMDGDARFSRAGNRDSPTKTLADRCGCAAGGRRASARSAGSSPRRCRGIRYGSCGSAGNFGTSARMSSSSATFAWRCKGSLPRASAVFRSSSTGAKTSPPWSRRSDVRSCLTFSIIRSSSGTSRRFASVWRMPCGWSSGPTASACAPSAARNGNAPRAMTCA